MLVNGIMLRGEDVFPQFLFIKTIYFDDVVIPTNFDWMISQSCIC